APRDLLGRALARSLFTRDPQHHRWKPARTVSFHSGNSSVDVSREAVDDAAIRRLWLRRRCQRQIQVPAFKWSNGIVRRIRLAYEDGKGLEPPAGVGRGGKSRSRHRHAARHEKIIVRHPAGLIFYIHDDKPHRLYFAGNVYRRRQETKC